jgi:hypothetical protein
MVTVRDMNRREQEAHDAHYATAERLIAHHGFDHRLRTPDALHLAVAGDLREQGLVDCLVASDGAVCDGEFARSGRGALWAGHPPRAG